MALIAYGQGQVRYLIFRLRSATFIAPAPRAIATVQCPIGGGSVDGTRDT